MIRGPRWMPAVAWMVVIMGFSSPSLGGEHTARVIEPFLAWLMPWASAEDVAALHLLVRKLAHLTEYGILALLWFRGPARSSERGRAWIALGISAAWALVDEAHRATTLTRTASAADVALDVVGAVSALALARGGWRAVDRCATALLWLAAAGGTASIVVDVVAGARPGWSWLTVAAATLMIVLRRRRRAVPQER